MFVIETQKLDLVTFKTKTVPDPDMVIDKQDHKKTAPLYLPKTYKEVPFKCPIDNKL